MFLNFCHVLSIQIQINDENSVHMRTQIVIREDNETIRVVVRESRITAPIVLLRKFGFLGCFP